MAPKLALFTKGSQLPLNQGFQNRLLVKPSISTRPFPDTDDISYIWLLNFVKKGDIVQSEQFLFFCSRRAPVSGRKPETKHEKVDWNSVENGDKPQLINQ